MRALRLARIVVLLTVIVWLYFEGVQWVTTLLNTQGNAPFAIACGLALIMGFTVTALVSIVVKLVIKEFQ